MCTLGASPPCPRPLQWVSLIHCWHLPPALLLVTSNGRPANVCLEKQQRQVLELWSHS